MKNNQSKNKAKVNSFFAGIGGFDLGFERAGAIVLSQCEINPFGNEVLATHWPLVTRFGDIRNIDSAELPKADIWCGGFPCQDVSVARGVLKREGLNGKNTGLFFPFAKLLEQQLPKVVLLENVTGLLSSHSGQDFHTILDTLVSLGYGVAWRVLNSRYFGVPQSRPRIYICAWLGSSEKAFNCLYENQAAPKPKNERLGFVTEALVPMVNGDPPRVPQIGYCLAATSGRHTGTDWSRTYISYQSRVRRMTPLECERLQGFDDNWTLIKSTDDKSDEMRYHALGNAVSVPVVTWIARRIVRELEKTEAMEDSSDVATRLVATGKPKAIEGNWTFELDSKISWKFGGIADKEKILQGDASSRIVRANETHFGTIVELCNVSDRYFLSSNAATGILRRVDSQNRTLFVPLREALESLSFNAHQGLSVKRSNKLEFENDEKRIAA